MFAGVNLQQYTAFLDAHIVVDRDCDDMAGTQATVVMQASQA